MFVHRKQIKAFVSHFRTTRSTIDPVHRATTKSQSAHWNQTARAIGTLHIALSTMLVGGFLISLCYLIRLGKSEYNLALLFRTKYSY
jgi:hypothetical protein